MLLSRRFLTAASLWVCVLIGSLSENLRAYTFAGGTGEPHNPYQIATAEQLVSISSDRTLLAKHFVLLEDVDLDPSLPGGKVFSQAVIGNVLGFAWEFSGTFDGKGHVIRNLAVTASKWTLGTGLFATIGLNGTVKNLGIEDARIMGGQGCGGLAEKNKGTISSCYVTGSVTAEAAVGGLVAENEGTIESCHSHVVVSGQGVGGLVADNRSDGILHLCYSTGSVSAEMGRAGGLVGNNDGDISWCHSSATVTGRMDVGGLVGHNYGKISGCCSTASVTGGAWTGGLIGFNGRSVSSCYSAGSVTGGTRIGGLVGENHDGSISSCYSASVVTSTWSPGPRSGPRPTLGGLVADNSGVVYLSCWDIETSGLDTSAGGKGRTTAQMQTSQTFEGWGYDGQWTLDETRDYPRLVWEDKPGALIIDQPRTYGGGSGEPNDPYQIWTVDQLVGIGHYRDDFGKCFVLMQDVNLAGADYSRIEPIGTQWWGFTGVFDGMGRTISCLTIEGGGYLGLFGMVDSKGQVKNLGAVDVKITGSGASVGGMVGLNAGHVTQCFSTGEVQGSGSGVGGLVGSNSAGGIILSSYSTATVAGIRTARGDVGRSIGGLVGGNGDTVACCYSAGRVTGEKDVGGLIGWNSHVVYLSYWDTQASTQNISAAGKGKTTAQMQTIETFKGWGYDRQWTLDEGRDYPRLVWEGQPGIPIVDLPRAYDRGTGEPNDPYQIWTAEQLVDVGWHQADFDKCFALMADVDLRAIDPDRIIPIGTNVLPFTGVFDGRGYEVQNLRLALAGETYIGLFGYVGRPGKAPYPLPGTVENLRLVDVEISGGTCVGGLVGWNGGTVLSCSVTGRVEGTIRYAGGLVGSNMGTISSTCSTVAVTGSDDAGGLIGSNGGTVSWSYSMGSVAATGASAGGLTGSNSGTVSGSYSTDSVTGGKDVGGLVGHNSFGSVNNCYFLASADGGGPDNKQGTPLTMAQMRKQSSFIGWDFVGETINGDKDIWCMPLGDYPRLAWEDACQ
jgi:hypothetical protein